MVTGCYIAGASDNIVHLSLKALAVAPRTALRIAQAITLQLTEVVEDKMYSLLVGTSCFRHLYT
jgi:hypothetical protein